MTSRWRSRLAAALMLPALVLQAQASEAVHAQAPANAERTAVTALRGDDAGERLRFSYRGDAYELELEPVTVRAPGFTVYVQRDGRMLEVEPPAPTTYRGRIVGRPDSRVTASITDRGVRAEIVLEATDEHWAIEPAPDQLGLERALREHVIYTKHDVEFAGVCACQGQPVLENPNQPVADTDTSSERGEGVVAMAELAWDVDFAAFQRLGSSVENAVAEVERITNAVNSVYESQVGITHILTGVVVRDDIFNDPYPFNQSSFFFDALDFEWRLSGEIDIPFDLVHLLTGRDIISNGSSSVIGVAFLNGVCNPGLSYGINEIFGSDLLQTMLVAHELGHNWTARHCNNNSDCAIMCSALNACNFNSLTFGSTARNSITTRRDQLIGACLDTVNGPLGFELLQPIDGDTDVEIDDRSSIRMRWTAASGASSYRVLIDDNPSFSDPEVDTTVSRNVLRSPAGALQPNTTYSWTVEAINNSGIATPVNGVATFTTGASPLAPAAFTAVSPADDAITGLTPVIAWEASERAESYAFTVEIADGPADFPPAVSVTLPADDTEYRVPADTLEPNTAYIATITALNELGSASATLRFRTAAHSVVCAADFDGDGQVSLTDFDVFARAFGARDGDLDYNAKADFDEDGDVDLTDFGIFGEQYLNSGCAVDPGASS